MSTLSRDVAALSVIALYLALTAGSSLAQDDIRRGTIKAIDQDENTVTISHDGQEETFHVDRATRFMDAEGKPIEARLNDERLKPDVQIFFKAGRNDDRPTLVGLKLAGPQGKGRGPRPAIVSVDTSALKPLPELGPRKYQGFEGGLYPKGSNERPAEHEAAGLALARQIEPLDADGKPDVGGKIVLLSVGMSNTSQAFSAFQKVAADDPQKNAAVELVNGAQGGMSANRIVDPDDGGSGEEFWTTVDDRLRLAGVTPAQVQAVWIKQADPGPKQGFPMYAQQLKQELAEIVHILPRRFANIKLTYLSCRTYGGYARSPLNPEPYAYESGFAVKWLIEDQLRGDRGLNFNPARGNVAAPWLSWGPYLWANGARPNADGLSYQETDFADDGTHESPTGQAKVARQLLGFFKTDSATKPWFVK